MPTGPTPGDLVAKPAPAPVVLVVDDEAPVRRLLAVALSDAGYEVVEARNGIQALDLIEHGSFALVLLDNRMPRLGGLDVLRNLRAQPETRTLPVILVTGADDVADRVAGLDAGATDYVIKPFDLDEVLARVRAQLRERQAWVDVVQARFDERASIAQALARASERTTPELVAEAICEELCSLRSVSGAVVLWFTAAGLAMPLALAADGVWALRPGEPAPGPLGRYLRVRADLGPWIERGDVDGDREPIPGTLLVDGIVACAPFGGLGQASGLLLLATEASTSTSEVNAVLASAIDFAGVTASLLRQGLDHRRREQAQRMSLASVVMRRAFVPHFQPIVTLADGYTVGYEALTRFTDGTPPEDRFVEAAHIGLGLELEQATLAAALLASRPLPPRAWLSLNVSPGMILATDILRDVLRDTERDIVLELSEHERIDDYDRLRSALDALGLEVLLSVDDAGSGFASLRHILILQPAFMKLDRSWVQRIDHDPARQALISGLYSFAIKTDCRLIAEGVETEAERAALADLGVHLGQGYLMGRPEPAPPT